MSTQAAGHRRAAGTDRLGGFAAYFKRYMGASAVVTAALPIPVAAFRLVPAYAEQRAFLGVYTSLFAFLVLAFLFYSRERIARGMFRKAPDGFRPRAAFTWLPLLLICASLLCVFYYHGVLGVSIEDSHTAFQSAGIELNAKEVLEKVAASDIPMGTLLIVLYLCIFLFAEAAFVLMALKEYLQDQLGISEHDLLSGRA
jgi:hypothetical protein